MHRFIVASAITAIALLSPAGATASNKETAQHIAKVLNSSGRLHNYDFGVKYKDGTAWLIGRVSSEEQSSLAAEMAEQLPEVSRVVNQLQVTTSAKQPARLVATAQPVVRAAAPRGAEQADMEESSANPTVDSEFQVTAGEQEMGNEGQPARVLPMLRSNAARPANGSQAARGKASQSHGAKGQAPRGQAPQAGRRPADGRALPRGPQGQQVQMIPVVQGPNGKLIPLRQAQRASAAAGAGQPSGQQPRRRPFGLRTVSAQSPVMGREGGSNSPMPAYLPTSNAGAAPTTYDQPHMPNYSWPSYASYPNYAGLTYPKQYSPTAWPYIGPFYPYPQVPLGWRKVTLEWADGWWFLDFDDMN